MRPPSKRPPAKPPAQRQKRPKGRPGVAGRPAVTGPTQRQLRAGELVRHALVTILREEEIADPVMVGVSTTVAEVRVSPDLRHATCFAEPLGGAHADEVIKALNRHAKFLRGRLGHLIDLKFTPDLHFIKDESFDAAARMNALFAKPEVARDLGTLDDAEDKGA